MMLVVTVRNGTGVTEQLVSALEELVSVLELVSLEELLEDEADDDEDESNKPH